MTWIILAYFLVGLVAARVVRKRTKLERVTRHESDCRIRRYGGCDCSHPEYLQFSAPSVAAVLGAVPLWPAYLIGLAIFGDLPNRAKADLDAEIAKLEKSELGGGR